MTQNRSYYSKRYKPNCKKKKAGYLVLKAIKKNIFVHHSYYNCVFCDVEAQLYHHINYNLPLLLMPMCIKCHRKLHTDLKKRGIYL